MMKNSKKFKCHSYICFLFIVSNDYKSVNFTPSVSLVSVLGSISSLILDELLCHNKKILYVNARKMILLKKDKNKVTKD